VSAGRTQPSLLPLGGRRCPRGGRGRFCLVGSAVGRGESGPSPALRAPSPTRGRGDGAAIFSCRRERAGGHHIPFSRLAGEGARRAEEGAFVWLGLRWGGVKAGPLPPFGHPLPHVGEGIARRSFPAGWRGRVDTTFPSPAWREKVPAGRKRALLSGWGCGGGGVEAGPLPPFGHPLPHVGEGMARRSSPAGGRGADVTFPSPAWREKAPAGRKRALLSGWVCGGAG